MLPCCIREGDLHRLAKKTDEVAATELRLVFAEDVLFLETTFLEVVDKDSETPLGEKPTDRALVYIIKSSLRRQAKRLVYALRLEQLLAETYPDPEAEPLSFQSFQSLYRQVLSNSVDLVGWTPLHWASNRGTSEDGVTPLHEAARAGQKECVMVLHELGGDLEAQTMNGNRAIHLAAKYGQVTVLQYMNLKECNLLAENQMGFTALHMAARYGQLAVVNELRAIGFASADKLQHTDKLGFTPRD